MSTILLHKLLREVLLIMSDYRFKPDVKLRFITEELGFMSDEDAGQFIVNHNAQHLLEERGNDLYFLTGKGVGYFDAVKAAAFGRVDIKGQI